MPLIKERVVVKRKKKSAHTPTRTHDATSRLLAAVTITSRAAWEREEAEAAPAHACKLASRSAVRSGAPRRPGPLGRGDPAAGWLADAVLAAAAHRVGTLTVAAHCSWAANTYYQNNKARGATCDFGGAATISTTDPSTRANSLLFCSVFVEQQQLHIILNTSRILVDGNDGSTNC
jgi:hypothetical protein